MAETISKDRGRAADAWVPGFSYWSDEFIEELRTKNEKLVYENIGLYTEIRRQKDVRAADWENCCHQFKELIGEVFGHPYETWTQEQLSGYGAILCDAPCRHSFT